MTDVLRSLLETRRAMVADVTESDGVDRLLVLSDLTGTVQLYELGTAGSLSAITDLPEPVSDAAYVPGRLQAVIAVDQGGDERHQLYLIDLEGGVAGSEQLEPLTSDHRYGHHLAGVSPDGDAVAYLSNRANGVDFDLWICDLATRSHRCVYAGGGWCHPSSGFSPDGRWVPVVRPGPLPLDSDLVLVDVVMERARIVLPHQGEAAEVGSPVWSGEQTVFVSSNVGRDRAAVVRYDLLTGEHSYVTGGDWDTTPVAATPDGRLVAVQNHNGANRIWLVDLTGATKTQEVPLPEPGVIMSYRAPAPRLSPDGSRLYYNFTSPRRAGDVWSYDLASGKTRRLTASPAAVGPDQLATPETVEVSSFDGQGVPAFVFRPQAAEGAPPVVPVVVEVHGGPEAQAMLWFDPVAQGLVAAGYAVVVPNVRGSTGYGKHYASLDDTTRRLDSVRDLAAVHAWLASAGLDSEHAALWGGSYGGYMVLAGLAFQPELWAAGVDIVGISDLVTFLENTSDYRRAHRELEYGSLATDRAFLASASPLRHADAIRAPLFIIHGRNDPRVPVSEAEQLAARLRAREVRCEVVIYDDEGHGLARLPNRLDAYPRAVAFLTSVMGRDETRPADTGQ